MTTPARNTPCPCGSGRKYKYCCAAADAPLAREDPGTMVDSAIVRFQNGDYERAEAACKKALAVAPRMHQAFNLLGILAQERGDFAAAAAHLSRAVSLDAGVSQYQNNLGNALRQLDRHEEALSCFDAAIRLRPELPEPHHNRGNVLQALDRLEEALSSYEEALRLRPNNPEANNSLGNTLSAMKCFDEAYSCYRRAVSQRPEYADAFGNLGNACKALGNYDEAIAACREAIRLNPSLAEPYCILGDAYQALSLGDQAITAFQEALRLNPGFAAALNSLGSAFRMLGRYQEAIAAFHQAVEADSVWAQPRANLGATYLATGNDTEAIAAFAGALECDPEYLPGIEGWFEISRKHCAWEKLEETSARYEAALLRTIHGPEPLNTSPFTALNLPLAPLAQRALVERIGARIATARRADQTAFPPRPSRRPGQRLRIGYLSSDYRSHAVAHVLGHLFALHNRTRFEVVAYSTGQNDGSAYRLRIERQAEHFVDMHGWSPLQIAQRIHADGVEILVDLNGHTMGNSLHALALRPAPLQIHALGYPGTVGKDFVDYSLVDAVICPPEHEHYYSEQVYRLPDTYQINDRQPIAARQSRASYGLPEEGFVFCCFNASYKLEPLIFQSWLRILDRVPGSVLWLFRSNLPAERNLRAEASRLGCPQERIIFGGALPKADHLARLHHADLMLDTPAINAMSTASDALWAGVPVLSILGDSFPRRAGAGILSAIGLPDLIMPDLAAYEATAIRLATNPEELAALRVRLEANRLTTPLFDTPRFVRNLEAAYEELWTRHLTVSR